MRSWERATRRRWPAPPWAVSLPPPSDGWRAIKSFQVGWFHTTRTKSELSMNTFQHINPEVSRDGNVDIHLDIYFKLWQKCILILSKNINRSWPSRSVWLLLSSDVFYLHWFIYLRATLWEWCRLTLFCSVTRFYILFIHCICYFAQLQWMDVLQSFDIRPETLSALFKKSFRIKWVKWIPTWMLFFGYFY